MPPKSEPGDYWDTCVFVAYLNAEPGRADLIDQLLNEAQEPPRRRIFTSIVTAVEISHLAREKTAGKLDPLAEAQIDALLRQPPVVTVELAQPVIDAARRLMRLALERGYNPKPIDAIHLATAIWLLENGVPIVRFLTYDKGLPKYASLLGIPISEPAVEQPKLPLLIEGARDAQASH